MKLQINDSGSWRDILKRVPEDRRQQVMDAGTALLRSLDDTRITLRLLADDGMTVYAYCEGRKHAWRFR